MSEVVTKTTQNEIVYSLCGICKGYSMAGGRLEVLRGIDLDVRQSELLVIQGKSGVGKSTLLHIMGLLDHPDAGTVSLEGEDVTHASRRKLARLRATRISFVFQFFHLLPEFTALENVRMPGMISSGPLAWRSVRGEAREKAEHFLEAVGLADRAGHRPNQLSGGERQRVALARALFSEPAMVLCDEPTGNLDIRTSDAIHELLARINDETGQTMVVVTHDAGLANYASRVTSITGSGVVEVTEGGTKGESGSSD